MGELDNRGSHFYLAMYWAQALAVQDIDSSLQAKFSPLAQILATQEKEIVNELNAVQGKAVDMGGYYQPDKAILEQIMRPSALFNQALASL